jgi:glucan phosphorylase
VSKTISELYKELPEKDEHKTSKEYKKLSPKMKEAVDAIFKEMESKPSDFLNTFDKTINSVSKKYKVTPKKLMDYFEAEVLSI